LTNDVYSYVEKIYTKNIKYIEIYIAKHCYDINDTQDIIQNIFIKFIERINTKGKEYVLFPKAFLIKLAKDELSRFYHKKADNKEFCSDDEALSNNHDEEFLLEEYALDNVLLKDIWSIINSFNPDDKKIFILRYKYDVKLKDIAKIMNLNINTVKTKLNRGLTGIRQCFDENKL
jgi:RNA polymerase sigma-70 factor (ECF subfamily)